MTEYTVVTALSPKELIETVNEKIKQGWTPIGGYYAIVGAPYENQQTTFSFQALVR